MEATPSLHATWRKGRTRRLITGAGVTAALFASVLFPVPARAITTETAATLTETQKKVEDSAAALDKAAKNLDALQEQIAQNEARIAELEEKLPEAQDKASRAMREMYKHSKSSNPLMSFVLNTQSLDSLISGMKYMDQVNDANVDAVRELSDMQTELEAEKTKLNAAKVQAESEKQSAQDALSRPSSCARPRRPKRTPRPRPMPPRSSRRPPQTAPPVRSRPPATTPSTGTPTRPPLSPSGPVASTRTSPALPSRVRA